jgi:hypothetical protein
MVFTAGLLGLLVVLGGATLHLRKEECHQVCNYGTQRTM